MGMNTATADAITNRIDPYEIHFYIPGLPPMPNEFYSGKHYGERSREKDKWHMAVMAATCSKRPRLPLTRAHLKLIRFSPSRPDYDGLVGSFKLVVDGLVKAGVLIDDNLDVTGPWDCSWVKSKKPNWGVGVVVKQIQEGPHGGDGSRSKQSDWNLPDLTSGRGR